LSLAGQDAHSPQVATNSSGDVTISVWQGFETNSEVIQAAQKVITSSQSEELDDWEQPQGLPVIENFVFFQHLA
jgi:hypothetical protein